MGHPKRHKSAVKKTQQKQGAAKQGLKKKQLLSVKSRNEDLLEKLDREAHSHDTLHNIHGIPEVSHTNFAKSSINVEESLLDMTEILLKF